MFADAGYGFGRWVTCQPKSFKQHGKVCVAPSSVRFVITTFNVLNSTSERVCYKKADKKFAILLLTRLHPGRQSGRIFRDLRRSGVSPDANFLLCQAVVDTLFGKFLIE